MKLHSLRQLHTAQDPLWPMSLQGSSGVIVPWRGPLRILAQLSESEDTVTTAAGRRIRPVLTSLTTLSVSYTLQFSMFRLSSRY